MNKSIIELRALNTNRLLRFYKAERKRFYGVGYWCDCGCGEMIWEVRDSYKDMESKFNDHKKYLETIKSVLNTREHVKRN
jgi:hypothetical protein